MINRYMGEIRINPVAILRNDDFNNFGEIADIDAMLSETITLHGQISERVSRLRDYLRVTKFSGAPKFSFDDGGFISMKGFSDVELQEMKSKGLIDVFDFANDRDWVKKYGGQFGLAWEGGRAVKI